MVELRTGNESRFHDRSARTATYVRVTWFFLSFLASRCCWLRLSTAFRSGADRRKRWDRYGPRESSLTLFYELKKQLYSRTIFRPLSRLWSVVSLLRSAHKTI